jgi:hypothetical protein
MKLAPIIAGGVMLAAFAWRALASGDLVVFPEQYADGVHYATVKRGNITEELFTSRAAIEAAKSGQPLPSGTVITVEDHRDGKLFRYVVMEKRTGWGAPARQAQRRVGIPGFQRRHVDQPR